METKYRAWILKSNKMADVRSIIFFGNTIMIETSSDNHLFDNITLTNSNEKKFVLMQSTGLIDCNGNKIFDGDIINIHDTVNGQSKFVITIGKTGIAVFYDYDRNRRYEYDIDDLLDVNNQYDTDIEIVGNIYEGTRN